jgi:hypothetical protein
MGMEPHREMASSYGTPIRALCRWGQRHAAELNELESLAECVVMRTSDATRIIR